MSRNGKIARLTETVRDELNTRLENGEEGPALLDWLNALPEVQQTLKADFDGAPITKQNLSEWRQGGFREWQIRWDLIEEARQAELSADQANENVDLSLLAGNMAALLAARYAALLNNWDGEPDPKFEEKARVLRGLNRDLAMLQKTLCQAHRQKREQDKAEIDERHRELEMAKQQVTAPIWAKIEADAIAAEINDGVRGQMLAEVLTRTKYNLPPPKNWEERLKRAIEMLQAERRKRRKSKQVRVSRTKSKGEEAESKAASPAPDSETTGEEET